MVSSKDLTITSQIPGYEFGHDGESHDELVARVKRNASRGIQHGMVEGWFESIVQKGNPVPFPRIIKLSKLTPEENTMAHVFVKAGVFASVSDAKRAGWKNTPLVQGEFWFNNRTIRIQVNK